MYRLVCQVNDGIFSGERLIRFPAAGGEDYTALVDASLVQSEGTHYWVAVSKAADRGARSLVALPPDGTRVWVPSNLLTPA